MISPKVRRFAIYTLVNVVAGWADFVSFLVLTHLYGLPTLQSIFSYAFSMLVNFQFQKDYVFIDNISNKSEFRVFLEFAGTGIFGLASTMCVIWSTINILGFSPAIAKTIAMLVCFVVLYIVRSQLVFTEKGEASASPRDEIHGPCFTERELERRVAEGQDGAWTKSRLRQSY